MTGRFSISEQASTADWLARNLSEPTLRKMGARESEAERILKVILAIARTLAWLKDHGDRIRAAFGKTALESDGIS